MPDNVQNTTVNVDIHASELTIGPTKGAEPVPLFKSASVPQLTPPVPTAPVAPGMVRFFHGRVDDAASGGGARWFSQSMAYAQGYQNKAGLDKGLYYLDLPENHPLLEKAFDDTGASTKAPYKNFEAPEEIAKHRKLYVAPPVSIAASAPATVELSPVPQSIEEKLAARHANRTRFMPYNKRTQIDLAGGVDYLKGFGQQTMLAGEPVATQDAAPVLAPPKNPQEPANPLTEPAERAKVQAQKAQQSAPLPHLGLAGQIFTDLSDQARERRAMEAALTGKPIEHLSDEDYDRLAKQATSKALALANKPVQPIPMPLLEPNFDAPKPVKSEVGNRAQEIFEELRRQSLDARKITAGLTGKHAQPLTSQETQQLATQATNQAIRELGDETGKTNRGFRGLHGPMEQFGNRLSGLVMTVGTVSGLHGLAGAASPAAAETLTNSFQMLTGEIGLHLMPTILGLSHGLQIAAQQVRGMDLRGLNSIARAGLALGAGGQFASMLGLARFGPVGLAAGLVGLSLSAPGGHGSEALLGPTQEIVRLLGSLADALVPFAHGFTGLIVTPLNRIVALLNSIPIQLPNGSGGTVATTLGGATAGGYLGYQIAGPAGIIPGAAVGGGLGSGSSTGVAAGGAAGGAWIGMTAGAAAGSFLGPAGTAVGGLIGLIGGGIGGYALGGGFSSGSGSSSSSNSAANPNLFNPNFAVSTGFVNRQTGIEEFRNLIQQEAVKDPAEQARFERHMRYLENIQNYLALMSGGGNNLTFQQIIQALVTGMGGSGTVP